MPLRLVTGRLPGQPHRGMTRERRAALFLIGLLLAATVVRFLWFGLERLFDGPDAECGGAVGSWPAGPLFFVVAAATGLSLLFIPIGHRIHRRGALLANSGALFVVSAASALFVLGWWIAGHSPAGSCGGVAGYFGPLLPIALVGLVAAFLFVDTLHGGHEQPLAED
ncbi:hypothetical protein [Nocardioides sp.]|uniref:hypothetical protein n=1 Tax=Nocardioides sp. TaxID=35761 RepID=UPI0039E3B921